MGQNPIALWMVVPLALRHCAEEIDRGRQGPRVFCFRAADVAKHPLDDGDD